MLKNVTPLHFEQHECLTCYPSSLWYAFIPGASKVRPKCLLSGWTFVRNEAGGTLGVLVPNAGFQVAIWSLPRGSMHSWASTKSSRVDQQLGASAVRHSKLSLLGAGKAAKMCNSSTFNSHLLPEKIGQPYFRLTSLRPCQPPTPIPAHPQKPSVPR